jgi:leucyl/phenylalanyl-tRNA---protein transferase
VGFFDTGLPRVQFPEPVDSEGLLAVGGDLSPAMLISAYGSGVFPWYSGDGPVLWWSPDPRFVLYPEQLHVSRRLARRARSGEYQVTVNKAFMEVIQRCSQVPRPGQDGTWITDEMIEGYCELHRLGYAHSFESWHEGSLVGGLYGVSVGALFCGESMFTLRRDAGKVAFIKSVSLLVTAGFHLVDCQIYTDLLASFGAVEIPRSRYLAALRSLRDLPVKL